MTLHSSSDSKHSTTGHFFTCVVEYCAQKIIIFEFNSWLKFYRDMFNWLHLLDFLHVRM